MVYNVITMHSLLFLEYIFESAKIIYNHPVYLIYQYLHLNKMYCPIKNCYKNMFLNCFGFSTKAILMSLIKINKIINNNVIPY
jgi:hypothetical protein